MPCETELSEKQENSTVISKNCRGEIGDEFVNTTEDYYYDREEFLNPESTKFSHNSKYELLNDLNELSSAARPLTHHYSLSTDDLNRTFPIRKASCTSCALCEANAGIVNRTKDGGFPLRKVASCSICTWDIDENFSDNLSEYIEEEAGGKNTDDLQLEQPSSPVRKRRNSYTYAMEDGDFNVLENLVSNNTSATVVVDKTLTRSPPDGGEEVIYRTEEVNRSNNNNKNKNKNKKSKQLDEGEQHQKKNKKSKQKVLKPKQNSLDRKVSQEFDEIFGKVRQSPNTSFDNEFEDSFDVDVKYPLSPTANHSSPNNNKKSKRVSFNKVIRTPSFLRRNKKSKLDQAKSRSVEHLYRTTLSDDFELYDEKYSGMKKAMSSLEMSSYLDDSDGDDVLNADDESVNEMWINYLNSIGGIAVFGGNENLRFLWYQLSSYQNELLQSFDDFLKTILDDMQRSFKKCQDLEVALSLKTQQQEKETSKIYEDAELAMKQERDQMQEKHLEKEEQVRIAHTNQINVKEQEIQELNKLNTEFLQKENVLVQNNHSLKQTIESLEVQASSILKSEASLKQQNEKLLKDNKTLLVSLNGREETLRELQEQLVQMTNEANRTKESYESCLRKYKDVSEEKEYLEANISNLNCEIEDLKNQNKSMFEETQSNWSRSSSMDLERAISPTLSNSIRAPMSRASLSFDENSNSMSYDKATDTVKLNKRINRHYNKPQFQTSSSPLHGVEVAPQHIQTPSEVTPIKRSQESIEGNDVVSPLHRTAPPQKKGMQPQQYQQHPKRTLPYGYTGQTPIRLASKRPSEYKVIFAGEANVGKTSLIRRICHGHFRQRRDVTLESDSSTKKVQCDDQTVTLKLWDTVGQERFNSIPPSYFRKSDVVILVYDVEDETSFYNARKWLRMIHDYTNENIFLFLIGNKSDLHHKQSVQASKGQKLASENDAMFLETSAKTGENLEKLCDMIATTLLEREETVFIRNDYETNLCNLSYSVRRSHTTEPSICCQ